MGDALMTLGEGGIGLPNRADGVGRFGGFASLCHIMGGGGGRLGGGACLRQ